MNGKPQLTNRNMARRIDEEYYALSEKVLQLRENTKVFDAYTEAALVKVEQALATTSPEPIEGFNAIGLLGCLLSAQPTNKD